MSNSSGRYLASYLGDWRGISARAKGASSQHPEMCYVLPHMGGGAMEYSRLSRRVVVVALALLSAACGSESRHIKEAQQVVSQQFDAWAPPTIHIETDAEGWADLSRPGRTVGIFEVNMPCGGGSYNRISRRDPNLINYDGTLSVRDSPFDLSNQEVAFDMLWDQGFLDFRRIVFSGSRETRNFHCQMITPALDEAVQRQPSLFDTSMEPAGLILGRRSDLRFESPSESGAEKGDITSRPMHLSFTYAFTPTMRELTTASRGSGWAELTYNQESQQWAMSSFRIRDPDLSYQPRGSSAQSPHQGQWHGDFSAWGQFNYLADLNVQGRLASLTIDYEGARKTERCILISDAERVRVSCDGNRATGNSGIRVSDVNFELRREGRNSLIGHYSGPGASHDSAAEFSRGPRPAAGVAASGCSSARRNITLSGSRRWSSWYVVPSGCVAWVDPLPSIQTFYPQCRLGGRIRECRQPHDAIRFGLPNHVIPGERTFTLQTWLQPL